MFRLLCIFLVIVYPVSCASLATPDSVMVGQGVGDRADGTFVYVNWAIPQPKPKPPTGTERRDGKRIHE